MFIFDSVYYHYFIFYSKVLRDPDPKIASILSLSFNQAIVINGILDISFLKLFCFQIAVWFQFTLSMAIAYINYLRYNKSNIGKEFVNQSPRTIKISKLSLALTILFFLITVSWLFWGPIVGRDILINCKGY